MRETPVARERGNTHKRKVKERESQMAKTGGRRETGNRSKVKERVEQQREDMSKGRRKKGSRESGKCSDVKLGGGMTAAIGNWKEKDNERELIKRGRYEVRLQERGGRGSNEKRKTGVSENNTEN